MYKIAYGKYLIFLKIYIHGYFHFINFLNILFAKKFNILAKVDKIYKLLY